MEPREKVSEDMMPHLNMMSESYDLSNHIVCEQPVDVHRIKKIEKVILQGSQFITYNNDLLFQE